MEARPTTMNPFKVYDMKKRKLNFIKYLDTSTWKLLAPGCGQSYEHNTNNRNRARRPAFIIVKRRKNLDMVSRGNVSKQVSKVFCHFLL